MLYSFGVVLKVHVLRHGADFTFKLDGELILESRGIDYTTTRWDLQWSWLITVAYLQKKKCIILHVWLLLFLNSTNIYCIPYSFLCVFIYLAALGLSCSMWDLFSCGMRTLSWGMWDLVPWPRLEPGPPALGAQSLSHWTTREVLSLFILVCVCVCVCVCVWVIQSCLTLRPHGL